MHLWILKMKNNSLEWLQRAKRIWCTRNLETGDLVNCKLGVHFSDSRDRMIDQLMLLPPQFPWWCFQHLSIQSSSYIVISFSNGRKTAQDSSSWVWHAWLGIQLEPLALWFQILLMLLFPHFTTKRPTLLFRWGWQDSLSYENMLVDMFINL